MLTDGQRWAGYARQAGAEPDTWTRRQQDRAAAQAAGARHLPPLPGTGPQRRRAAHKTRRAALSADVGKPRRAHRVALAARAAVHRRWIRDMGH
jgi:hypothetical protein